MCVCVCVCVCVCTRVPTCASEAIFRIASSCVCSLDTWSCQSLALPGAPDPEVVGRAVLGLLLTMLARLTSPDCCWNWERALGTPDDTYNTHTRTRAYGLIT